MRRLASLDYVASCVGSGKIKGLTPRNAPHVGNNGGGQTNPSSSARVCPVIYKTHNGAWPDYVLPF